MNNVFPNCLFCYTIFTGAPFCPTNIAIVSGSHLLTPLPVVYLVRWVQVAVFLIESLSDLWSKIWPNVYIRSNYWSWIRQWLPIMPWYTKALLGQDCDTVGAKIQKVWGKVGAGLGHGWGSRQKSLGHDWGMIEARSGLKIKIADGVKQSIISEIRLYSWNNVVIHAQSWKKLKFCPVGYSGIALIS